MQMDSLFHSSMRKSRLVPNWSAHSSLKEFTKYYLLNGNYVQKKYFRLFKRNKRANKDGYFCIAARTSVPRKLQIGLPLVKEFFDMARNLKIFKKD